MPTKDRDADAAADDDRPREKHRRSKSERKPDRDRDRDRDRERDKDRDKDKDKDRERRHRSSKSSRSKLGGEDAEAGSHVSSSKRHRKRDRDRDRERDDGDDKSSLRARSLSDVGRRRDPASPRAASQLDGKRVSLPYPSFSKAHSKEAVASRDDISSLRNVHIPTPEPTDAGDDDRRRKSDDMGRKGSTSKKSSRPPTPPETDISADKRKLSESNKSSRDDRDRDRERDRDKARDKDRDRDRDDKPTASGVSRSASKADDRSRVSRRSASSSQATYIKTANHKSHDKLRTSESKLSSSSSRHSPHRSGSVRSLRKSEGRDGHSSPSSVQDSSPRTPTQAPQFSTPFYDHPDRPDSSIPSKTATPASVAPAPPPPPPPPPPMDIHDIPRVDYLLQNGGLPHPVPRHFLSVLPIQNGARAAGPPLSGSDTLFAPFFNLLDQYNAVLDKQGSVAVATGHRSVARRLLDRLENIFSRDLPPHGCACIMCERSNELHRGLTWGDVLEWVSGRIELPQWPPFDLAEIGAKAAEISAEEPRRPSSPIKLDPDIAEEFREHYLRQTKKVRSAVDKWLNSTPEAPIPAPQEVDDETLAFAVLTNLDDDDRPFFNALLSGARELKPATRAPTPMLRQRNDFVVKTGLSLQRLYRLQQAPRDAESVTYLIKNPHTHDLLVTLSNINNSEWEILTSGRFDGFLWSGADMEDQAGTPGWESRSQTPANSYFAGRSPMSPGPRSSSAMSSRGPTPFSRGATPASFISTASSSMPGSRQAVSNDEEMEMAAIAEMEREIYQGMESLEDAFERLHHKAEVVRTALRQRGAGLMQSLQSRRRIDVLPTQAPTPNIGERPSWAPSSEGEGDAQSDDDWFEEYDIMPDDSASNISSSRHRRPKRRTERRTPAPIEEDEEE